MSGLAAAWDHDPETWQIKDEPWYRATGQEVEVFTQAARDQMPVLLKGPTGCGKTRFVRHMAWKLGRPLVTVACHEDLGASDLIGRHLITDGETRWVDGPLAAAVRMGAICYLDEVVEARNDALVVIHPLADDRRMLPIEKRGELLRAPPEFLLAISYNPGYQSVVKDLKQSTRQRFIGLAFDYPERELEAEIVAHEGGVDGETALRLVKVAARVRKLKNHGLDEGVSTRLLVYAARLVRAGLPVSLACRSALIEPLTDDPDMQRSIAEVVRDTF